MGDIIRQRLEMGVKMSYLAGIIRKKEGGQGSLALYHNKAYKFYKENRKLAEEELKEFEKQITVDVERGSSKAQQIFDERRKPKKETPSKDDVSEMDF